jgi:hypothetical protein
MLRSPGCTVFRFLHAALLITLLLAAVLRLWQLDVLPPGLFDEAFNGWDAKLRPLRRAVSAFRR